MGQSQSGVVRHPAIVWRQLPEHLCGSGFQSWISAAQMIRDGEAGVVLAGGTEQMSQIPYIMRGVRFGGIRMGHGELEDYMT